MGAINDFLIDQHGRFEALAEQSNGGSKNEHAALYLRMRSSAAGRGKTLEVQNERSKSKLLPNLMGGVFPSTISNLVASGRYFCLSRTGINNP